jgi:spore coat polysaccharide biosynthesis protein SpsF (cytidylyltransferase family)
MNIIIAINARLNSSRLEKKHFSEVDSEAILSILIRRIQNLLSSIIQKKSIQIYICTGNKNENAQFEEFSTRHDIGIFYGDDNNIPYRQFQLADNISANGIVSVDGDDIFCAPEAIASIINALIDGENYVITKGLPFGMNCFGYSKSFLGSALKNNSQEILETGWTDIFDSRLAKNIFFKNLAYSEIRATLDYDLDLDFFSNCTSFIEDIRSVSTEELIDKILKNKLYKINNSLNETYWANFRMQNAKEKT